MYVCVQVDVILERIKISIIATVQYATDCVRASISIIVDEISKK